MARISVDLPAPFAPRMPSTLPFGTSKVTSLTASTMRTWRLRDSLRPMRMNAPRSVGFASNAVRYRIHTSSTRIETSSGISSDADGKVPLPRDEDVRPEQQGDDGPAH